ncbi:MAG: hypothetical protein IKB40_04815 [Paludibacteraceae bacterium]|nr:hypothetical protein [Paludibacteraceae bacterium]
MKKIFYLVICIMALLFAACEPNAPATSSKVETGAASDITTESVVLHGVVNVDISQYEDVEFGMMVSEDKAELNARDGEMYRAKVLIGKDFELTIDELSPETKYYYCAWVFLNNTQYEFGAIKEFTTLEDPKIDGIGTFSVSDSKQVTFSKGNLQYTQSTNTWSFASTQWEVIGTDNVTGGSVSSDLTYGDSKEGTALADKVDLFGWSTSATNFGVSTSDNNNDYSGSFVDWGKNKIGNDAPNTWRTLTYDEWKYLLNTRPNASSLKGVAQVNGVNGLILLPDSWTCPSGVTFKSGFHNNYCVEYYAAYQTFTAEQWSKLESAGAVFLPAAGDRYGSNVYVVQSYGNYWSATEDNSLYADYLYFHLGAADMDDYNRDCGRSVRLVKDLQ